MKLEDTPTDILKLLLNDQNSWAAIELWKCGNRTLNTRLAHNVITHVNLQDDMPSSKSRWPRCLKEFKLESLTISRPGGSLGSIDMLKSELKQLHAGLKNIEIHALSIGMCFFDETTEGTPNVKGGTHVFGDERDDDSEAENYDNDDDNQENDYREVEANKSDESSCVGKDEPRPTKRSKTQEVEQHDLPHTSMWNLGLTWPHLERLELSEVCNFNAPRTGCFGSNVFAMLPRSLTWFGFYYALTYECLVDLSALPSGLKTLRLPDESINRPGLKTLPKSITNLRYSVECANALPLLLKKPSLLPNLKEFPFFWEHNEYSPWLDKVHAGDYPWPENISSMVLMPEDDDMASPLPSNLTALDHRGFGTCLTSESLARLPRSLTFLEVYAIDWEDMDVKDWPSTFTKLTITQQCKFGTYFFQYLPRRLKELHILSDPDSYEEEEEENEEAEDEEDDIKRISKDTESLRTIGKDSLLLDDELWIAEKHKLLAAGRQTYIDEIEAGGLFGLPLSLTELEIDQLTYPIAQKLLMPPHMHKISGRALRSGYDDSTLFGAFDHISPVSLHFYGCIFSPAEKISPTVSALYLSNLISLTFKYVIVERPFQYLPRGLRHLVCCQMTPVTDLDDLPQLESLTLGTPLLQPLWTSHLPRSLIRLTANHPILGDDLEHLPPGLKSLEAEIRNATVSQYRQLPRSICTWTLRFRARSPNPDHLLLTSTYKPLWRMWKTSEEEMNIALGARTSAQ